MSQFDDLEQQHDASILGMWIFLATEVMFFGGLIAAYAVYRALSPREFAPGQPAPEALAGMHQHRGPARQQPHHGPGRPRRAARQPQRELVWFLLVTMVLGRCFLGIKAVEYYAGVSASTWSRA